MSGITTYPNSVIRCKLYQKIHKDFKNVLYKNF